VPFFGSKSSLIYRERIRRSVLNTSETPIVLEQVILNKCLDGRLRMNMRKNDDRILENQNNNINERIKITMSD
jgi:hypothetical protein